MAGEGCDLIVTSGGLGPTADDLTAEVVARFAGVELVLDEEMEAKIAAIIAGFARRMRFDPEALKVANRKQAMVPVGATALDPAGTAPGLVVEVADGPTVIVLPGPPRELHAMWDAGACDRRGAARAGARRGVREPDGAHVRHPRVRDRAVAARDRGRAPTRRRSRSRPACAAASSRSRSATTRVPSSSASGSSRAWSRATSASSSASTARRSTIRSPSCCSGHRIGLAESCTGGLLAARLTERPGASDYVAGGVVSYSDEAKRDLLGVDEA